MPAILRQIALNCFPEVGPRISAVAMGDCKFVQIVGIELEGGLDVIDVGK